MNKTVCSICGKIHGEAPIGLHEEAIALAMEILDMEKDRIMPNGRHHTDAELSAAERENRRRYDERQH